MTDTNTLVNQITEQLSSEHFDEFISLFRAFKQGENTKSAQEEFLDQLSSVLPEELSSALATSLDSLTVEMFENAKDNSGEQQGGHGQEQQEQQEQEQQQEGQEQSNQGNNQSENNANAKENGIFVGNIQMISKEDLASAFKHYGEVTNVHVVTDKLTGGRKGYAFIHFATQEGQQNALNSGDIEFRGIGLQVKPSTHQQVAQKTTIYIGNLPDDTTDLELKNFLVRSLGCSDNDVRSIDLKTNPPPLKTCKGFGFVELSSQNLADLAIAQLQGAKFKSKGVVISWANHKSKDNSRQKTLYVAHLPADTNELELRNTFSQFGEVINVTIARNSDGTLKGYAFIDYKDRLSCAPAISFFHNSVFKGSQIQVSIAKPVQSSSSSNVAGVDPFLQQQQLASLYGFGYGMPNPYLGMSQYGALRGYGYGGFPGAEGFDYQSLYGGGGPQPGARQGGNRYQPY